MSKSYRLYLRILIILICLFLSKSLFAQPNITNAPGQITHGSQIEIEGNSFGYKGTPYPIRWDTFENGTSDADLTSTGYWQKESSALCTYNASDQRHNHSTLNYKHHNINSTNQGIVLKRIEEWASSSYKFLYLWKKLNFIKVYPGQFKNERIESSAKHADVPIVIIDSWANSQDDATSQYYMTVYDGKFYNLGRKDPPSRIEGVWYNVVIQYKESDLNTANGSCTIWVSSTSQGNKYWKGEWGKSLITQTTLNDVIQWVKLGYNSESGGSEAIAYYDDIYIDNSWARIEIGDSPIYENCTHREIQIPTAWSENSITINANQGSFQACKPLYIFVIDPAGVASAGKALIFSSNCSDVQAPGAPDGLTTK